MLRKNETPEIRLYGFLLPTGRIEYRVDQGSSRRVCPVRNRLFWEATCQKCGTVCFKIADGMKAGSVTSCGCKKYASRKSTRKFPKADHAEVSFRVLLSQYRCNARKRNLSWELPHETFKSLTRADCYYCGCHPKQAIAYKSLVLRVERSYVYNGVDRKDNSVGYTLENCVPCCGLCNEMKMGRSVEEFLSAVRRIHAHSNM